MKSIHAVALAASAFVLACGSHAFDAGSDAGGESDAAPPAVDASFADSGKTPAEPINSS